MAENTTTGDATRHWLDTGDDVRVSYLVQGGGPPVLLLHGFISSARSWWKIDVAQRLARTRTVIAPDFRGHGQSGKPVSPGSFGQRMLMDVVELFDHLEIDAADVVGFSMGAELALALAVHYPDRVRSLTIAGSGWSPREIVEEYRKWFDILAENAENPDSLRALIEDVPEVIGLPDEAIKTLTMPLVGIIGELDDERPYVERICDVRPDFQPIVLPGLDHLGTWHSPEFPALLERALSGDL